MVSTWRNRFAHPPPDVQAWLTHLRYEFSASTLSLQALQYNHIVLWLQHLHHDPVEEAEIEPLAQWLFKKTQGQPLYISEMLKLLFHRQLLRAYPATDGTWSIDSTLSESKIAQWSRMIPAKIEDTIRMRLATGTWPPYLALRAKHRDPELAGMPVLVPATLISRILREEEVFIAPEQPQRLPRPHHTGRPIFNGILHLVKSSKNSSR